MEPTTEANGVTAMTPEMMTEVYSEDVEEGRTVEVHVDQFGEFWYGVTIIRSPKDWTFHPRAQFGTGENGQRNAIAAAQSLAQGIRFDRTH